MSTSAKTRMIDTLLLAGAGLLFAGLGLWTLLGGTRGLVAPGLPKPGEGAAYLPAPLVNPATPAEVWRTPAAREGDGDWLFDVFTPPVIYYDLASRAFSVTPPDSGMGGLRDAHAPFGVELVEVRRTPYRIQLVGYAGSEGDYIATFDDLEAGSTFLARAGRTVESAGILLRSFNVEKVRDESGGGTAVQGTIASAQIRDLRQDRDVTLVQKVRLMNDEPAAVLRVTGDLARQVEAREGATITTADGAFVVGRVAFDPPAAEVTRLESSGKAMEVRRLVPVPPPPPPQQPAQPKGFAFPPPDPNASPFGRP